MKTQASFHSLATISHKRNFIVSLTAGDGTIVSEHEQKANLFLDAFKQRLGNSDFTSIEYDLSSILTSHSLDHLDVAFSHEEIESIITNLPNNHAPGPDGFNGLFIKKCWNIVKMTSSGCAMTSISQI